MNKALFLDRDGVINIDKGYVHKPEDCVFVDGIFDLVRKANSLDYKVIVVTNQAGIARGYYTEEQFKTFSDWMCEKFKEQNSKIDYIYFCPHHPESGLGEYLMKCNCRKPNPGMFINAEKDFSIAMQHSIMIGDNITDLEAAAAASVGQLYLFKKDTQLVLKHSDIRMPYRILSNFSELKFS